MVMPPRPASGRHSTSRLDFARIFRTGRSRDSRQSADQRVGAVHFRTRRAEVLEPAEIGIVPDFGRGSGVGGSGCLSFKPSIGLYASTSHPTLNCRRHSTWLFRREEDSLRRRTLIPSLHDPDTVGFHEVCRPPPVP